MINRGAPFTETFNFKTADGQIADISEKEFEIVVMRNMFIQRYVGGQGLTYGPNSVTVNLTGAQTSEYKFSKISYSLNDITDGESTPVFTGVWEVS